MPAHRKKKDKKEKNLQESMEREIDHTEIMSLKGLNNCFLANTMPLDDNDKSVSNGNSDSNRNSVIMT